MYPEPVFRPTETRNAFKPPMYRVRKSIGTPDWRAVSPIVLITDLDGEDMPAVQPRIKMAWTRERLFLHVVVHEENPCIRDVPNVDHPLFWQQDSVDLRIRRPDGVDVQIILAASGLWSDSLGLHDRADNVIRMSAEIAPRRWTVAMSPTWSDIGMPPPEEGMRLKGQVAVCHVWGDDCLSLWGFSATDLGFGQPERQGDFVFDGTDTQGIAVQAPQALTTGANRFDIRIAAPAGSRLVVTTQSADQGTEDCFVLEEGENAIGWSMNLRRPEMTQADFQLDTGGRRTSLARICVRAPAAPLGRERILPHPRLFYGDADIARIRQSTDDPLFARAARSIRAQGKEARSRLRDLPGSDSRGRSALSDFGLIGALLNLWLVDGDDSLIAEMAEGVKRLGACLVVEPHTHLGEGGFVPPIALAYDTLYTRMDENQRAAYEAVLARYVIQHLHTARARSWSVTCVPNSNPVSNAAGTFASLCMMDKMPEAEESLTLARKLVHKFQDYCSGEDGGNSEGMQYWQYGTQNLARIATALERAYGSDVDKFFEHPSLRKTISNVRVGLSNDGCLCGVNDTIPMPLGTCLAWLAARRYADAFALWYGDFSERLYQQFEREQRKAPYRIGDPFEWLWRPERPTPAEQPPLETCLRLNDIQYSIARTSSNWDAEWVAGLKGARPYYAHHHQPDAGSFWLDVRGERLLIDPGYYKAESRHHCLPIVNGEAPDAGDRYLSEVFVAEDRGSYRYLAADSTPAYRGTLERIRRHLVLMADGGLVIVDDIVASDGDADVCSQFQAGGPTSDLRKNAFAIKGQAVSLEVKFFGPSGRVELQDERDLNSTDWGYHFATCLHFPVHYEYRSKETCPLVTIIREPGRQDEATVTRADGRVTVVFGKETLDFVYHESAWRLKFRID